MDKYSTANDITNNVSVNQLWDGILFVSITGYLDSTKAEQITNSVLNKIQEKDAPFIIVDISNVPAIDSAVSKHILNLSKASALMGCECVLSGINAPVAYSMTTLNISFEFVTTRTTIQNALKYCLNKQGFSISKNLNR